MAFNFNWHPLTADSDFYSRAKNLLTTALNKSPKPPIIVADILVTELNLGTTPPELEILEIGDLADDRFRGIFKMQYSGDAFLTLQTRVQANPLNTYLSTAPSFTNPQPLAASSPLTIPLQITLSQFKLSGFIILVFSKAKGVTLVFRNDPLESLVVSSTFDSIPFIKDYLQKEIEKQLRNLFQDELPAIIHRLSLQWCGNEYDSASTKSPPMPQATFNTGHSLSNRSSFDNLQTGGGGDMTEQGSANAGFNFGSDPESDTLSSKNLLKLATLMDSQRTLSLFTPSIKDAVFRAWATTGERNDPTSTPATGPTTYTFDNGVATRPGLMSMSSSLSLPGGAAGSLGPNGRPVTRSSPHGKKKKTRVVNLRRSKTTASDSDTSSVAEFSMTESSSTTGDSIYGDRDEDSSSEVISPPISPPRGSLRKPAMGVGARRSLSYQDGGDVNSLSSTFAAQSLATARPPHHASNNVGTGRLANMQPIPQKSTPVSNEYAQTSFFVPPAPQQADNHNPFFQSKEEYNITSPSRTRSHASGSIAEKAWMMKLAGEMARRLTDEKGLRERADEMFGEGSTSSPPPAYMAKDY